MADSDGEKAQKLTFKFLRGVEADAGELEWPTGADVVRKALSESLNAKNVAFLIGAGCSSYYVKQTNDLLGEEWRDVGIPTMAPLAKEFTKARTVDQAGFPTTAERKVLIDELGIDIGDKEYARNLERLMELLFSLRFSLSRSTLAKDNLKVVNSIIQKVQAFLWGKCTNGAFANGDSTVGALYETFYRKLVLRDRSLPRPWIFTTNYDLFNETAMDRLGLPYANGFSGVVERRFNPATFRYALAEQLDLTNRKWSAVDGFVYLCKIHGSISWTEDDHGLFPIRETAVSKGQEPGKVMIYPTPAKQNSSLGSPYADLFREFQSRIVREQSVLFTMGYAFGDEHINNIIYQALTIPTFRLVIFVDPTLEGEVAKLRALNDPRIWIIGGSGPEADRKAHYFDTIIEEFMPQRPSERIDDAIRKVLEAMSPKRAEAPSTDGDSE